MAAVEERNDLLGTATELQTAAGAEEEEVEAVEEGVEAVGAEAIAIAIAIVVLSRRCLR